MHRLISVPQASQKKLVRLFKLIRILPDDFLTNEVTTDIRHKMGIRDVQRCLIQLVQGGLLNRELTKYGQILYKKTETAKKGDDSIVAALVENCDRMWGYEDPEKRRARRRKVRPAVAEVTNGDETALPFGPDISLGSDVKQELAFEQEEPSRSAPSIAAHQVSHGVALDEFDRLRIAFGAMKMVLPEMTVKEFLEAFIRHLGVEGGGAVETPPEESRVHQEGASIKTVNGCALYGEEVLWDGASNLPS